MSLEETVRYYYVDRYYNCCEAIIHGANEYYGLNVTEEDMKMFGGFGGGMYTGIVCGTLVACVAVLSKMVVKESARKEGKAVRPIISDLVKSFRNELDGISCAELKPKYYTPEDSCLKTVLLATKVLERCVDKLNEGSVV